MYLSGGFLILESNNLYSRVNATILSPDYFTKITHSEKIQPGNFGRLFGNNRINAGRIYTWQ